MLTVSPSRLQKYRLQATLAENLGYQALAKNCPVAARGFFRVAEIARRRAVAEAVPPARTVANSNLPRGISQAVESLKPTLSFEKFLYSQETGDAA
jgi:hypothetical protein